MLNNLSGNFSFPEGPSNTLVSPLNQVHLIIWLTDWIVGITLSCLTLLLILASLKKLIRMEFVILLDFAISSIFYKLSGVAMILFVYLFTFLSRLDSSLPRLAAFILLTSLILINLTHTKKDI